jgi:branched-chain amino acid transport system substrate-binding protein
MQPLATRGRRLGVAVVLLALVLAACGGGRNDTSSSSSSGPSSSGGGGNASTINTSQCATDPSTVTPTGDTIKIGTSLPQSGLYSAFTDIKTGEKSYFDYVNSQGGVEVAGKKYKIQLDDKDDQYLAEQTVANVNSLINDDKVFALFDVVGTKNNLAVRQTIESDCIPNLYVATGAPQFGNPDYKWTLGTLLVPYPDEMKALVDYLKKNKPNATVAILRASDDFGQAYSESFRDLIKGTNIKVVKEASYNAESNDTKSQVASLAASKADVFIVGATLLACPDALKNAAANNWKPITYMSGTCTAAILMTLAGPAAANVLSVAPVMDPGDPTNASNAAMQTFKAHVPAKDGNNAIVAYGWSAGALLAETFHKAKAMNRLAVMESARNLNVSGTGLQYPGQTWVTNANDNFVGETFYMVQYDLAAKYFKKVGSVIDLNGQTADFSPPNLLHG